MKPEENYTYDNEEYINLGLIFRDYMRLLKKTWLILVILCVVGVGGVYLYNGSKLQKPSYNATIYYSVESGSNLDTNKVIAKRLANGVSTMLDTADFKDNLCKELGVDEITAAIWSSVKAIDSSNLFNITLSCTNPNLINRLMKAFENVYPDWVTRSIGNCKLTILDEDESTGINYNLWSKKKVAAVGLGAACGLWFLIATILIISVRKIHNQAEMYQVIDAECLGTIPEIRKKARRKSKKEPLLISNKNVDKGFLQSIRTSRDILEREIRKGNNVMLFTSTMAGEGKSLLTVNLAYALARRGKKVAVVDADIYRGGVTELLNIPDTAIGFSDYLCSTDKKQIGVYKKDSLFVIPVGMKKEEGQSNLNAKSIAQFVDGLKRHVDVVLIDTPPVGLFGDALAFVESVDEVIYVIRGNYASVNDIRKAIQPFYQSQKLGGYILNRVTEAVHDSSGRYSYGYSRYRYGGYGYHRYGYGYKYAEKKASSKEKEPQKPAKMTNDDWNL